MAVFDKILVPVDFGAASMRALEMAVQLAKLDGASLTVVHVWEIPSYGYGAALPAIVLTRAEAEARGALDDVIESIKGRAPNAKAYLACGTPWREIVRIIRETKPALVVMGTHGRRGLDHVLLGSVAEKLVRVSPAPVLTVR